MRSIETNISKNSCYHVDKSFESTFPRIIECNKPKETIQKGPQANFANTVESIRASLRTKMLMKTQIFEKQYAIFPVKERFWPVFSPLIDHEECQGTIYKCTQGNLPNIAQMIRSFRWDLRNRLKQTFQKITNFTMTKDFSQFYLVLSRATNLKKIN